MEVREAKPDDAVAACEVLRRSIGELCQIDHHGAEEPLKQWLANKTPDNVRAWICGPGSLVLVACERETIVGVGKISAKGRITLNYVAPEARFRGVSKALLAGLEAYASRVGAENCALTSTETARRFYRSNGYVDDGQPISTSQGVVGYPMIKRLRSHLEGDGK